MSKRIKLVDILKEGFKDDFEADKAVDSIENQGAFKSLVNKVSSVKDLSRAIEALMRAMIAKKPQLSQSADKDSRLKQVNTNLNYAQGDKVSSLSSPTQQQTTKP
jgi:hypothetical protein